MPEIDSYFDEIDANRSRRARELSELKLRFSSAADPMGIGSKAVVVLSYAHWEGFYNDCVKSYVAFLKSTGRRIRDKDWMMLVGAFNPAIQALHDKRISSDARREFISRMRSLLDSGYEAFVDEVVLARSNLDFEKIRGNFEILSFDVSTLQRDRLRLDRELVGWRHLVAHGDQPDLTTMDIEEHIDLTSRLLLIVADQFQGAMLDRLSP